MERLVGHDFDRNLQLADHRVVVANRHVLSSNGPIRTRSHDDLVLPARVHNDQCNAGRLVLVDGDTIEIDRAISKQSEGLGCVGIVTDATNHSHVGSHATCSQGLIGAFAPRMGSEHCVSDRFSRLR